jgi:hypothetical protein
MFVCSVFVSRFGGDVVATIGRGHLVRGAEEATVEGEGAEAC